MENKLTRIFLGGKLGMRFGKEWNLDVSSPAEAIRAIDINSNGELRKYLQSQGSSKFYKIAIDKKDNLIEKSEIHNRSGNNDIYILPAIKGKNSGWGKIIAAVVILVISYFFPPAASLFGSYAGAVTTALYATAASLAVGGISQLLAPTPNFSINTEGDSRGSNIFQGNAATISQGGAVGLVYGRALVTPMPISISFDNFDQSRTSNYNMGSGGNLGGEGQGFGNNYVYGYLDIFTTPAGDVTWVPAMPPTYTSPT